MSTPFLGEIRVTSFNFAPRGWAMCNGQLLSINQNQALFSILGTTYGGDGQTNFALPNLQGRTVLHMGSGFTLGQQGGEAAHTLTPLEMPAHVHIPSGHSTADTATPTDAEWATAAQPAFGPIGSAAMASDSLSSVGGNQPHENRPPYLVLNFVIAIQGIFPSQN